MDWGDESLDAPENVQYFNSLLWMTETRRVSFSEGAENYMSFEPPESEGILELTHFEIGEDRFPNNQKNEGIKTRTIDGNKGADPLPIIE